MTENTLNDAHLGELGLNLQGVLDVDSSGIQVSGEYSQLLVFGHGGRRLWTRAKNLKSDDPIDEFSVAAVQDFLKRAGCSDYSLLYPFEDTAIDLIEVGRMLGWHHDSLLGIGIHPMWGTWFAYRVVIAANTDFTVTVAGNTRSPCASCSDKPCISRCPASAVVDVNQFDLQSCMQQRLTPSSECAMQCPARLVCPVGGEHAYGEDQLTYHYGRSLETLRKFI